MPDAKQLQLEVRTAALLARLALAELRRWSLESADVRDRVPRMRSPRRPRRRVAFEVGAVVLGLVVAGVVAKRAIRADSAPPEAEAPAPIT
jgi:hypothetical protein